MGSLCGRPRALVLTVSRCSSIDRYRMEPGREGGGRKGGRRQEGRMGAGEDKEEHGEEMCGYCTNSKSCTEAYRSLSAPHAEWRHGSHNLIQPLLSLLKNISKRALGKMLLKALDRNPSQGR